MRLVVTFLAFLIFSAVGYGQIATTVNAKPEPGKKLMTVEASCGECNFGMDGNNCDLAVRIDGKPYFVDGVAITEFGHPHDKNGFCVAIRKAEVQGEVVNGRFKATYFKLLGIDKKDSK